MQDIGKPRAETLQSDAHGSCVGSCGVVAMPDKTRLPGVSAVEFSKPAHAS